MLREAISFGRFSDPKQDPGDSRRRQQEAYDRVCQRYADRCKPSARFGFGTFFGSGESGFHGTHLKKGGSLRALLNRLQSGDIDPTRSCLVVEAFDRLGRIEPDLAMTLLSDIVRSGCPIVVDAPDMWIDQLIFGGPQFISIAAMLQLAHAESKQKSDRAKASWHARKRQSHMTAVSSVCPRWCRRVDGQFVLIPERVAIVQRVFEMCAEGLGSVAIARTLNQEGVPVLSGKPGKGWAQTAVCFLLRSRVVLGEYQPQERVKVDGKIRRSPTGPAIVGYYPAVVSEELFYRVQGCLADRAGLRGAREQHGINLFRGLLFDARTKAGMNIKYVQRAQTKWRYLVPSVALRDGTSWCSVPYDLLEAGFYAFVEELTLTKPAAPPDLAAEIEKEEAVIRAMSDRLELYNAADDPHELMSLVRKTERLRSEAQARREALRRRAAEVSPAESLDDFAAFTQRYEEHEAAGTLDQFHEVLRNKIREIVTEMWVLVIPQPKRKKVCVVQVMLRAGGCRWFVIRTTNQQEGYISNDPTPFVHPDSYLRLWKPPVEASAASSV